MWQLGTQIFFHIQLAYIFEPSYSTLATWVGKKSSVDPSELQK